jgi:hypothetical protein
MRQQVMPDDHVAALCGNRLHRQGAPRMIAKRSIKRETEANPPMFIAVVTPKHRIPPRPAKAQHAILIVNARFCLPKDAPSMLVPLHGAEQLKRIIEIVYAGHFEPLPFDILKRVIGTSELIQSH